MLVRHYHCLFDVSRRFACTLSYSVVPHIRSLQTMSDSKKDNLSVVIHKKMDLRLEQTPIPDIGADDVLCKSHSVGICGTDIHYWKHGYVSDFVIKSPLVLGHEASAVVVKVGANVKNLKAGDRVAIEPSIPCRKCNLCKDGFYNLCHIADRQVCGSPPYHGCLRRYFSHPADFCFKLPDNVTMDEGVIVEPLAVAVHAVNRSKLTVGQTVLVCGAGTLGLVCLVTAKAYGASKVVITDINQKRLELAKSMGADHTVFIDLKQSTTESTVKEIKKLIGSDGPQITFECTGNEGSIKVAIYSTATGGKVVCVGLGPLEVKVPLVNANFREVDILGVRRFKNCYPTAIYLIESGKVSVKSMVTHKYTLENSLQAFEKCADTNGDSVKVIITL